MSGQFSSYAEAKISTLGALFGALEDAAEYRRDHGDCRACDRCGGLCADHQSDEEMAAGYDEVARQLTSGELLLGPPGAAQRPPARPCQGCGLPLTYGGAAGGEPVWLLLHGSGDFAADSACTGGKRHAPAGREPGVTG